MTLVQRRLVGLGAFLAVGALATFGALWQHRRGEAQKTQDRASEKILRLEKPETVRTLTLDTPNGTFTMVRQAEAPRDERWQLTAPFETLAEESTVEGLANHLAGLTRTRAVGETGAEGPVGPPPDLALFQLDPPRFAVTITTDDGASEKLRIGKKSSFDGSVFVAVEGRPEVAVVPGALEYQVDRDLFKLRDKRLVRFDPDAIVRLSVEFRPERSRTLQRYVIAKKEAAFVFEAPRVLPADPTQIQGILSSLATLRAKSFVSEQATDAELRAHGLDTPLAEVVLERPGAEGVVLRFGQTGQGASARTFAALEGRSPLVELSSEWAFKKLMVSPDELRDRRVLVFERDDVRTIRLTKGDATLAFAKEPADGDHPETWTMTAPTSRKVSAATLSGLLYNLWSLKGEKVVTYEATEAQWTEHGLATPERKVELLGADGETLGTLLVGAPQGTGRSVAREGSRRIDLVEEGRITDLSFEEKDYPAVEKEP